MEHGDETVLDYFRCLALCHGVMPAKLPDGEVLHPLALPHYTPLPCHIPVAVLHPLILPHYPPSPLHPLTLPHP